MIVCLERGADLHMAQLMPLPLTVSCSSKIQIGFTYLVPAYPGCPGKEAVKWLCSSCSSCSHTLSCSLTCLASASYIVNLGLEKFFGPRPRPHSFWPRPHAQLASLTFLHSPTHTNEEELGFTQTTRSTAWELKPLYGALSQRGLLDPIKPAYNQSWPDGWLKLTASVFNLQPTMWIRMPAVLVTVSTITQNSLHPLSTHTHPFNGPFSGTTRVSRYQKGNTNLDFTEARDSEWQLH